MGFDLAFWDTARDGARLSGVDKGEGLPAAAWRSERLLGF